MLVDKSDLVTYMDISLSMRQQDAADIILAGLQSELESYLGRPIEVREFTEQYTVPSQNQPIPMSSYFYQQNLESSFYTSNGNAIQSAVNYAMPPETIYLRNSPVTKVKSVSIINQWSTSRYLGEAIKKEAVITSATKVGSKVTYTSNSHKLTVGQFVTVKNVLPGEYNLYNKQIIEVTTNTFSIMDNSSSFGSYVSGGNAAAIGNDYVVRRFGIDIFNLIADDIVTVNYEAGLDGEEIAIFKLLILRAATREMQNMHDDVVGVKDLNTRNVAPLETGFTERELNSVKSHKRIRIA